MLFNDTIPNYNGLYQIEVFNSFHFYSSIYSFRCINTSKICYFFNSFHFRVFQFNVE